MIIIVIAFLIINIAVVYIVEGMLMSERLEKQAEIAGRAAVQAEMYLPNNNGEKLYALTTQLSPLAGRLIITDEYGIVIADSASEKNGQRIGDHPELTQALTGKDSEHAIYKMQINNKLTEVMNNSAAVVSDGRIIGAALLISSVQDIRDAINSLTLLMAAISAAVALVEIIAGTIISQYITNPISRLSAAITDIGSGKFDEHIEIKGGREMRDLASAFNIMSSRLHDLDNARSEFVSSASHELKTPLSTIKILVETLLYETAPDPKLYREFLGDVNDEINRLNQIISELLAIVQLDTEQSIRYEEMLLGAMLHRVAKRLEPLAKRMGTIIEVIVDEEMSILCDVVRLEQAFFNLVDNAIKYSPEGSLIEVSLKRQGQNGVITVQDNGIGIPEEDLPKIFDRFYRVDKTRSRNTGGTGLGLSIVQGIINTHGGTILVASEEGKGTTFTISLPAGGN